MRSILKGSSLIVLIGSTVLLLILLLDTYGVLSDPEDYRIAQQFKEANLSWSTPSVLWYVTQNAGMAILLGSIAFMSFQYFRNHLKPSMVKIYWGVVVVFVVVVVAGYLHWMGTGYDH